MRRRYCIATFLLMGLGTVPPSVVAQPATVREEPASKQDEGTAGSQETLQPQEQATTVMRPLSAALRWEQVIWSRASAGMAEDLRRLDNYTCIQHVSRFEWHRRSQSWRLRDVVRFHVLRLGGADYYARLEDGVFVEHPRQLLHRGMVQYGLFQGIATSLFVDRAISRLVYAGMDAAPQGNLLRYQFLMEPHRNQLSLVANGRHGKVPGMGTLWLDPVDLRLRRLALENLGSVARLGLNRVLLFEDWAPVATTHGLLMMPQRAEAWMHYSGGRVQRNEVLLAQCREYRAESSVRFGVEESVPPPEAHVGPLRTRLLPEAVKVSMVLRDGVQLGTAKAGDTLVGVIDADVARDGKVFVPAGTSVEGRVRRIDRYPQPVPHIVLWLEFSLIRLAEEEYLLLALVETETPIRGATKNFVALGSSTAKSDPEPEDYLTLPQPKPGYPAAPGIASYVFSADARELPAGHQIQWRTVKPVTDPARRR